MIWVEVKVDYQLSFIIHQTLLNFGEVENRF